MKKVIMYSTPSCHYCNEAKKFFDENKIKYTVHNVAIDLEKRSEMVEKSGRSSVPVITIGDAVFVGFNKELLSKELGI